MKIRTDEDVRNRLMMSMGLMAAGLAILMFGFDIVYGWILAGLILTLGALYNAAKPKEDFIEDERLSKKQRKSRLSCIYYNAYTDNYPQFALFFIKYGCHYNLKYIHCHFCPGYMCGLYSNGCTTKKVM